MAQFPILGAKKVFKKIGFLCTTSYWFLASSQNPEKSNDPVPRKHPDRFDGILPATARGLASKNAVNWHLKVKDIEYNVGLTKNYCITVSMQKISSIHKLIQQILGSHELNDYTHF